MTRIMVDNTDFMIIRFIRINQAKARKGILSATRIKKISPLSSLLIRMLFSCPLRPKNQSGNILNSAHHMVKESSFSTVPLTMIIFKASKLRLFIDPPLPFSG